jgi:acetolactate synthase I/III small subunit
MLHTFALYVKDRPGVLNRVASLLRRRGFNIESLTVGRAAWTGVSRMTVDVEIEDGRVGQLEANLYKLVDVKLVESIRDSMAIQRELALIKVRVVGDFCLPDKLIKQFQLRIVDRALDSLVLEATGIPQELENLLRLLRPWGVLEMVRTGKVAMARGPTSASYRAVFGDQSEVSGSSPDNPESNGR